MNSKIALFFVALSAICFLKTNAEVDIPDVLIPEVETQPKANHALPYPPTRPNLTDAELKKFLEQTGKRPVERVRRADGRPYLPRPTPRPNFS